MFCTAFMLAGEIQNFTTSVRWILRGFTAFILVVLSFLGSLLF